MNSVPRAALRLPWVTQRRLRLALKGGTNRISSRIPTNPTQTRQARYEGLTSLLAPGNASEGSRFGQRLAKKGVDIQTGLWYKLVSET